MKMYKTPQGVDKYLNVELECDCGMTHYAPIKAVKIGEDAIQSIPEYVRAFGYQNPYIICDKITYEIAGKQCEQLLIDAGYQPAVLVIKHTGFDEATLGEIVIHKPDACDLMIGCGTGSITDMLRYSSFKLGVPCFTVCTGAPMDGFSASVGIMNVNNLKATMPAHSSEVIIGDTKILASAPYRMTIAGFADLIGKVNCLNDWKIASLVNKDHYCESIAGLVSAYVDEIIGKVDEIKNKEPQAVGDVMNALLISGATISLYGDSRAISGAEHHMSHYWEVLGEQQGKDFAMHGEQVAVGTVLALMLSELLRDAEVDFGKASAAAQAYSHERWTEEVVRVYGNAAEAIIALEEKTGKNEIQGRLARLARIEENWAEVKQVLSNTFSSAHLREILQKLGCPADPVDIGLRAEVVKDTLVYAKETRNRYTILSLVSDLGMMDELSNRLIEQLQSIHAV